MDDLWNKIREAVESLNPKKMVGLLYKSGYLDGLENTIRKNGLKFHQKLAITM
ncbi:hypothetical protein [Sutcliffiella halmapala]|uniref:hypothetical protein n=1 Tax=Sutcliffiella halmapala TaxID=79882 RepID=UPI001475AF89|nr:hypothetical protein [Sutcliffiella halmapala]